MPNCIYCEFPLDESDFYCTECAEQIKCKSCNSLLKANAKACGKCGLKVENSDSKETYINNETNSLAQPMNTFEFKETRTERTAKATFTDNSVDSLKEALSLVVSSYPLANIVRRQTRKQSELNGELFPETEENFGSQTVIDVKPKQISQIGNQTTERLKELFFLDENILTLEIQDLKQTGQKDFGMRLTYLRLLYSKEVNSEEFVLRDDLNATLKEAMGSLDPHVINWISNATDLGRKLDGEKTYIRLKSDGHKKALEILEEVYNQDTKGMPLEKKSRSNTKSSSKSDETQKLTSSSRKRAEKSKVAADWISKWQALNLNINLHGIAKDLSLSDRAVLALWVIQKATNGLVNTATTYKIAPVIKDLFFTPGDRGNLNKVLKNGYENYLQKTPDGWRITPTGISHAESLAGISSTASKGKSKK